MPPGVPTCNHGPNDKKFHCKKLSLLDISHFHEQFYKTKNKKDQDAFILKHCKVKNLSDAPLELDYENQRKILQRYLYVKGTKSHCYEFARKHLFKS